MLWSARMGKLVTERLKYYVYLFRKLHRKIKMPVKLLDFPSSDTPGAIPVYQIDVDSIDDGVWLNDQIIGK